MAIIRVVCPGSPAYNAGLRAGDVIKKVQGRPIKDYLDWLLFTADDSFLVTVKKKNTDKEETVLIDKGCQSLGLSLQGIIYDRLKLCHNDCIFCFVDQGHPESRPSLCLRDDDYRFSFLQGSFITLSNLTEADLKRIKLLAISPLFISVHTTNGPLRAKMMRNHKAANILKQLRELAAAGIFFHIQIVICPGYNDGIELENTLEDLSSLGENVLSIGVVPVGLTDYRQGLVDLEPVTRDLAESIITSVDKWQSHFLAERDQRIIYASDEFFWLTDCPVPTADYYEDYPMIENGIGLVRNQRDQAETTLKSYVKKGKPLVQSIGIITGVMGEWALKPISEQFQKATGVKVNLLVIKNTYYGSSVTVTGLLAAKDIFTALDTEEIPETLFIPTIIFNEEGKTLDDYSIVDFQEKFPNTRIIPVDNIAGILGYLCKEDWQ